MTSSNLLKDFKSKTFKYELKFDKLSKLSLNFLMKYFKLFVKNDK